MAKSILCRIPIAFLVLSCSLALALPGSAQTRSASIQGVVTDQTGAAIVGASVKATNTETGFVVTVTTGGDGRYVLEPIPPGRYDIAASASGFQTTVVKSQQLFVGTQTTVNFELPVGPVAEEVSVTAAPTVLETTKTEVGQVIQEAELDDLPVVNRSFTDLALLVPTVQPDQASFGGLAIAGQRDFNNDFLVDGVSNRSISLGLQLITLSQDWVAEFRVNTNSYLPEYGTASGGIISAITRSGTNDFHGRFYGFIRDEDLDALPAFTTVKAKFAQQRFGGFLGGPIVRQKLFFFGGYEDVDADEQALVTATLEPCTEGTRDPTTGTCIVPTGANTRLFIARVDWHPTANHIVNWRYNREDASAFNSAVGGLSTVEHGRFDDTTNWSLAGAWTAFINPNTINELRAVVNREFPVGGVNSAGKPELQYIGRGLLGAPVNFGTIAQDRVEFTDNFSVIRGKHTLKFGASFGTLRYFGDFCNFCVGRFNFFSQSLLPTRGIGARFPFDINEPDTYPDQFVGIVTKRTDWDERSLIGGLFGQDSWRAHPRLTVNFGLRYDTDGSLSVTGARRVHLFSPRVGLAWSLDKSDDTVLKASAGLFRDVAMASNLAGIFILNTLLPEQILIIASNIEVFNPFADGNPATNIFTEPAAIAAARQFVANALASGTFPDPSVLPFVLPSTINTVNPNLTMPQTQQFVAGITRRFIPSLVARGDFIYSKSRFLLAWRDVNINPDGVTRPDTSIAANNQVDSIGRGRYRAAAFSVDFRQAKRYANVSYTYARCDNNTFGILTGNFVTNPFNLEVDRGPCPNDIRHTFIARGVYRLPLGFEVANIVTARSAPPFSATGVTIQPFTRVEPRNQRRGDNIFSWDLRLGWSTTIRERITPRFFWEFFNLTNHRNFTGFVSDINSARFGQPTTALAPRRIQIGVRVDF